MSTVWNSQPLSFWVLAGVALVLVLDVGLLALAVVRSRRSGIILGCVGLALAVVALVVLLVPVTIDGGMCGRGAGAPGWIDAPTLQESDCRAAQWQVFWTGMVSLAVGTAASISAITPRFKKQRQTMASR